MTKSATAPAVEAVEAVEAAETVETVEADPYETVTMPVSGGGKPAKDNPHTASVAVLATLYNADPAAYPTAPGNARAFSIVEPDHDKRKAKVAQAVRWLRAAGNAAGVTTRVFPSETGDTTRIVFAVTAKRERKTAAETADVAASDTTAAPADDATVTA